MSLWNRIQNLPETRKNVLLGLYSSKNPYILSIRSECAQNIELKLAPYLEIDFNFENPEHIQFSGNLKEEIREEIRVKISESSCLYEQDRLEGILRFLQNLIEINLVLDLQTQLRREEFAISYWDLEDQIKADQIQHTNVPALLSELQILENLIEGPLVIDRIRDLIDKIVETKDQILRVVLSKWKRSQLLKEIGMVFQGNVDLTMIQVWCTTIFNSIISTLIKLQNIQNQPDFYLVVHPQQLPSFTNELTEILKNLIQNTLVVEHYSSIMMKGQIKKKKTVVRSLLGQQLANYSLNLPLIKGYFLKDEQIQNLDSNLNLLREENISDNYGILTNNEERFRVSNDMLTATFGNLSLADRQSIRYPLDIKAAIYFDSYINFRINELNLTMTVRMNCLSPPIIAIVNQSQKIRAFATIFWDYAFSAEGRIGFVVADQIPWPKISCALNYLFKKDNVQNGRELSFRDLLYLVENVLKLSPCGKVPRSIFLNENLKSPEEIRKFPFFNWIFCIYELIYKNLRDHWNNGAIFGYIGRDQVESLLADCPVGTFLARFSESELGAISISYVSNDMQVLNVKPFMSKELSIKPLNIFIDAIEELLFVYPRFPKSFYFSHNPPVAPNSTTAKPPYVNAIGSYRLPGLERARLES